MTGVKLLHCDGVCGLIGRCSAIDNRLDDTQCRLEAEIHLLPIELRSNFVRRGVRIFEEVAIQVRQYIGRDFIWAKSDVNVSATAVGRFLSR